MQKIRFSKMNGQGNDFIIIDATKKPLQEINLKAGQIARICDRHFGIGADGLIIVRNSTEGADFFMDYYNQDGSAAEMCGNGIRCMAKFILDKGLSENSALKILTRAGLKNVEILKRNIQEQKNYNNYNENSKNPVLIKVDMGSPVFEPSKIPVNMDKKDLLFGYFAGNYNLRVKNTDFAINCVSMGNPHCVIFLDNGQLLEEIPIDNWGPEIENNAIFPKKINVEFIKVIDNCHLKMRVWERGVGETLACGTGACASAVCAIVLEKVSQPVINVNLPGGQLKITWMGKNSNVFLEGTVENAFEGEYLLA